MLHKVNPPDCQAELNELIGYQRKVLQFAVRNTAYSDQGFRAVMGNDFVDWINKGWNHSLRRVHRVFRTFLQNIQMLTKQPRLEKEQVLTQFENDQDYFDNLDNPHFVFSFDVNSKQTHEIARDVLVGFYNLLGIGFPQVLFPFSIEDGIFRKINVVEGFKNTNAFIQYVCPCCDNNFADTIRANIEGYTLEHYFPKSLYPAICLHPLNLIPMCEGCNSRKSDDDPIRPSALAPATIPLPELFHPIKRPVSTKVNLVFSSRKPKLDFKAIYPPPDYRPSIDSYDAFYGIPSRWENVWFRIEGRMDRCIKQAIRYFKMQGKIITQENFNYIIEVALEELQIEIGREQFAYPAFHWLNWQLKTSFENLYCSYLSEG